MGWVRVVGVGVGLGVVWLRRGEEVGGVLIVGEG